MLDMKSAHNVLTMSFSKRLYFCVGGIIRIEICSVRNKDEQINNVQKEECLKYNPSLRYNKIRKISIRELYQEK